jgi:hypothetical protein
VTNDDRVVNGLPKEASASLRLHHLFQICGGDAIECRLPPFHHNLCLYPESEGDLRVALGRRATNGVFYSGQ